MEIRNDERLLNLEGETLRLFDLEFDFEKNGGSEKQIKPIRVTDIEAEEPKYMKYGYGFIRLVHSDSKTLPTELSARYEDGRKDHFALALNKKQWESSQELLAKMRLIISESGFVNLLDLTERSLPAPKVKSTQIDTEWVGIKDLVSEAILNTPITGFFHFFVDNSEIYIQGGFNSPSRIYLEASSPQNDAEIAERFKEAGWQLPEENSDFMNYSVQVFWGEKEVDPVSNFIVNTLSWVYELDPLATELSIDVQDND